MQLGTLLGQPVAQFQMDASKRAPRQLFFYRPQMVRLPPLERIGPARAGADRAAGQAAAGRGDQHHACACRSRCARIDELVDFHDLRFSDGVTLLRRSAAPGRGGAAGAGAVFRPAGGAARRRRGVHRLLHHVAAGYAEGGAHVAAEDWLEANRREVAALLTEEPDPSHLSDQEADESTSRYLSAITTMTWSWWTGTRR